MIALLREHYELETDASVIRYVLRKTAKAEGYVSSPPREDRQERRA
jgi:hypothetical protein